MGNSKMKAPSKKAVTQIVRGPHAAFPQTAKHCLHVVVWIKTVIVSFPSLFLSSRGRIIRTIKEGEGGIKAKKREEKEGLQF